MTTEITVPQLGESVTEATVAAWLKQQGDAVAKDEPLVELETDKATMEVFAPVSGTLIEVLFEEGADVAIGAVLARVAEGETAHDEDVASAEIQPTEPDFALQADTERKTNFASPSARKLLEEIGVSPDEVQGTGKFGRITKPDVLSVAATRHARPEPVETIETAPRQQVPPSLPDPAGREERVRMSRLRKRIAERLKAAQDTAAMLTTFNEADMSAVIDLRKQYRDSFEKRHGVRLGFMSFFVRAAIHALKEIPSVNAEIAGDEIVYKHYYHIGVAVSSPSGLVVPVVRDADAMSFADIEQKIIDFGTQARDGKLKPDDLVGGTFTISNGGIFGSLMSTPIINPPQSGILGMHRIQERPVVVDGEITVRPMMYLALSYDHRIIDGREAVTFLATIRDVIEEPQRLMLDI